MENTGGPLNLINGKMGISAPSNSVPVMALIRKHTPKSREELVSLIKSHYLNHCECGIVSKGTVVDFGKNLFKAQKEFWGENKFTVKECIQWEYNLFVVNSLKGDLIEKRALNKLKEMRDDLGFVEAEGFIDEDLRIDIIIKYKGQEIGGIQVKPLTFKRMRSEVIHINNTGHIKWGKPVYYLFYDDNENFTNIEIIIESINDLIINNYQF